MLFFPFLFYDRSRSVQWTVYIRKLYNIFFNKTRKIKFIFGSKKVFYTLQVMSNGLMNFLFKAQARSHISPWLGSFKKLCEMKYRYQFCRYQHKIDKSPLTVCQKLDTKVDKFTSSNSIFSFFKKFFYAKKNIFWWKV